MINQLPICDFSQDVISRSQPIDMNFHLIKNVKSPVNKFDAVNKAYVDRIKYKTTTGIIPNIVNPLTARHFFFTLSFGAGQIFSFLIPGAG